jgi:hypothetical protein
MFKTILLINIVLILIYILGDPCLNYKPYYLLFYLNKKS